VPIETARVPAGDLFWRAILRNVGRLGLLDLSAVGDAIQANRSFATLPPEVRRALARAEAEITERQP
jgi:hypothetical protein